MKVTTKLMFSLFAATLFGSACVKGPEAGRGAKSGGPVRIGFSMDTLKEERWQRDKVH